jgi:hypothetical protein
MKSVASAALFEASSCRALMSNSVGLLRDAWQRRRDLLQGLMVARSILGYTFKRIKSVQCLKLHAGLHPSVAYHNSSRNAGHQKA